MKYTEMKKKVLGMIEELNPDNPNLTDDPDIAGKIDEVTNQIMYELARVKKIPRYGEMEVEEGAQITFEDIGSVVDGTVYQVSLFGGVKCDVKAAGTVFKIRESGTAEIDCFVYPTRITEKNREKYTFELTEDVLEVMPYGIAADLLKSDVSADYESVYADRYESMLNRLDSRNQMPSITFEGGVEI